MTAKVYGQNYAPAVVALGLNPSGEPVPLLTDASGRSEVILTGSSAYGSGTLTSDATAPSNGDTVTIGSVTYTFKTALTTSPAAVPYEVLIGVSAAVALDNLKSAINATAGAGTTYGTGTTAHPDVTATTNTDTTQVVEAKTPGIIADIATTETSSHLSWGSATLTGGKFSRLLTDSDGNLQVAAFSNSVLTPSSLTRPADTTAYSALDTVSDSTSAPTVMEFTGMARANGGTGTIVKARLVTDQSTNAARFRVHLFHTSPTAINDNSPFTFLAADRNKRVGTIDFPAMATEGTGSDGASAMRPSADGAYAPPNLWYKCAAEDTKLYGILETLDAFTPASGQLFWVELGADGLS
jgi:hypothetical protein